MVVSTGPTFSGKQIVNVSDAADFPHKITEFRYSLWSIIIYAHGDTSGHIGNYERTNETTQGQVIRALSNPPHNYKIAEAILRQCNSTCTSDWETVALNVRGYRDDNVMGLNFKPPSPPTTSPPFEGTKRP
jgi:hypothetical protein